MNLSTLQKTKEKLSPLKRWIDFTIKHSTSLIILCLLLYGLTYFNDVKELLADFDISKIKMDAVFKALIFGLVILKVFKYLQKFIETKVYTHASLDTGIRYSISRLVGYLGWFIAIWGALSILGVNLENIAIVFGALSVGIGFGLQNIVNNFVSGLLILFERPIKTGDWIVVNGNEGIVKNIHIRSTELTTFDNTSVLIPNSTILSNDLTNLTHNDSTGRIIIPIGVAYGSDLKEVEKTLYDCAIRQTGLSKQSKPLVILTNFAESSINFELRVIVDNVMNKLSIKSNLMFLIYEAFNKNNIEIPLPQRVFRINPLDNKPEETPIKKIKTRTKKEK